MTKILIDDRNERSRNTLTSDLEIGGVGLVTNESKDINGTLIMRTHDRWISLNDPNCTWDSDPPFKITPVKELIISYII